MPSTTEHLEKYCHNKLLLSEELFSKSTKYSDWIITIAFYSALHLVEKKLCELNGANGIFRHTKEHKKRNNIVRTFSCFKKIRTKYITLYNQSLRARYDCCKFSKKEIQEILGYLKDIEQELSS